jgi:hypothetical protein
VNAEALWKRGYKHHGRNDLGEVDRQRRGGKRKKERCWLTGVEVERGWFTQPANATTAASWCLNGVGRTLAMALHRHLPFSLFSLSVWEFGTLSAA